MAVAVRTRGDGREVREAVAPRASREPWIDNLRVAVIAGVIVVHVSATYAVQMPWYYEERTAGLATQAILSALFGPGVFYAMAVLFLIAGMLTPRSLDRKGTRGFVADRVLRLGIPVVVGVGLVVPAAALIGALAEGEIGVTGIGRFLAYEAQDVDFGPMWFVTALLIFSLAYAGMRAVRPRPARASRELGWRHLLGAVGTVAGGSFAIRLVWPALSVTPGHLNHWEWPSMATLFALGVLAGERGWLAPVTDRVRRVCGWSGLAALLAATVFFAAVAVSGDDRLLGGWHPQALIEPAIEGVLAVAVPIWLLAWFRIRWNRSGPVATAAQRGSYAAYVFHPLVIVLLAVAVSAAPAPAEVKFLVVCALGLLVSFTAGWTLTRVRPLSRVF